MKIKEVVETENKIAKKFTDEIVNAMLFAVKKHGFEGQECRKLAKEIIQKSATKNVRQLFTLGDTWVKQNLEIE